MTPGWSALRGRRVGVWGVGVEGRATLRRLAADGIDPVVAETDAEVGLLRACDVVVKSPGISRYGEAAVSLAQDGVELVGGLGLWLAGADRSQVACITGTKGKSTTTAIAGHLAARLLASVGQSVLVGGNIGVAPWDPDAPDADWYVVEVSSYQATDLEVGPKVVAVTSLSQDHLLWHGDYATYVKDKLSLATRPGVETVVIPSGDAELEAHASLLGPDVVRVEDAAAGWVEGLGLLGDHNRRNALVAREVLVRLGVPGADDDSAVAAAAEGFTPLRHRLTRVATLDGVDFVDDSLSTNVLPTVAALEAFPGRRVALLVGGQDRGIDYAPLAGALRERGDVRVLALPDSGSRIAEAIRAGAPDVEVDVVGSIAAAVPPAFAWARPGGVVLLSPAAPSFGRYRDYAARADDFEAQVGALVQ